ncbi:MAG: L-2-amino-thiazoline-4-carboxylic acid hydrolase [bacterium]|nr:L-2-amino-thiazoline-4-carboxylic acid hydrolase [bacterium]
MEKKQEPENMEIFPEASECDSPSLRNFLIKSLISGCGASLLISIPTAAEDTKSTPDDCKEELKKQRLVNEIGFVKNQVTLINKLKEKFGGELVPFIKQDTIDRIEKTYKNSKKIKDRSLAGVKTHLWEQLGEGVEFKCIKDTPAYLEYKLTKCFHADAVRELKVDGEIGFALYCAWDIGFCKGLNPDIKFTRTKTLMNGDNCCNHTYELKKS